MGRPRRTRTSRAKATTGRHKTDGFPGAHSSSCFSPFALKARDGACAQNRRNTPGSAAQSLCREAGTVICPVRRRRRRWCDEQRAQPMAKPVIAAGAPRPHRGSGVIGADAGAMLRLYASEIADGTTLAARADRRAPALLRVNTPPPCRSAHAGRTESTDGAGAAGAASSLASDFGTSRSRCHAVPQIFQLHRGADHRADRQRRAARVDRSARPSVASTSWMRPLMVL